MLFRPEILIEILKFKIKTAVNLEKKWKKRTSDVLETGAVLAIN